MSDSPTSAARHRVFAIAAISSTIAATTADAALIIYGGPSRSSDATYLTASITYAPGQSAGSGAAVGNARYQNDRVNAVRFGPTSLGELAHTDFVSTANAINASGLVVGAAQFSAGQPERAARWSPDGTLTSLGNVNGVAIGGSSALAVNAAGTSTGFGEVFDGSFQYRGLRAVRWNAAGAPTRLDPLSEDADGDGNAVGYAINSIGTVVGVSTTETGPLSERAVRWAHDGTAVTLLGALAPSSDGSTNSYAIALNDAGTAAGYGDKFSATGDAYLGSRAIRWEAAGTAATELDTLGTDANDSGFAVANAIATDGTVVGTSRKFESGNEVGFRATRWDEGSTDATELDGLGATTLDSEAFSVNANGDVVGYVESESATSNDSTQRAVVWNAAGDATDLNTLIDAGAGWTLTQALSITDAGSVSGIGLFDDDGLGGNAAYERLFIIQLPEPTLGTAMACSMLALTLRRRRPRG